MKRATLNVLGGALFAVAFLPAASVFAKTVTEVYFATARHDLNSQARATLDQFVKANGKLCINLAGHTDTRGSLPYNQALSERRVRSVAKYIQALNFKKDITGIKAYGETHLAVAKEGDVGANRRVEVRSYKCGSSPFGAPAGGAAGVVPAWLAGLPLVCLAGACDFSSTSSTSTTTTTTTTTTTN